MPAVITHYFLSKRVLDDLKVNNTNIKWNEDAFYWGAQGPDFFYLSRIFPWQNGKSLRKVGTWFHKYKNPYDIINEMKKYYKLQENDLVLSYIAGFITHYVLDSTAHPFINYGANELHKDNKLISTSVYHHDIEANLDIIILRNETGDLPTDIKVQDFVSSNQEVISSIAKLYVFIIHNIFKVDISENKIFESINDYYKALKLMNDKTTLKKHIIKKVEKILKKGPILSSHLRSITEETSFDYANFLNLEWTNSYNDHTSTLSFFDLMDNSYDKSLELITNFLSSNKLKSELLESVFC